jgi:hypothetical protein
MKLNTLCIIHASCTIWRLHLTRLLRSCAATDPSRGRLGIRLLLVLLAGWNASAHVHWHLLKAPVESKQACESARCVAAAKGEARTRKQLEWGPINMMGQQVAIAL